MNVLKRYLKYLCVFFSALIFLQSCVVYHSKTITAQEAVQLQTRVKVISVDGTKEKFKMITLDNGTYYGVKKVTADSEDGVSQENIKVPLDPDKLDFHPKNKTASTIITIAIPVVVFSAIVLGISASSGFGIGIY